jgi:secreted trypsin-like serine protease
MALFGGLLIVPTAGAVVGGAAVDPDRYPAVVALAEVCTATLIGVDRLLTAGHCISYVEPGTTRVTIGDGEPYVARRVARHPRFRYQLPQIPAEPYRDVALVELDRPVPDVRPMRLSGVKVRAGSQVALLGYGTSDPEHLDRFGTLRRAELEVRGVGTCKRLLEAALRGQGTQFRGSAMLCTQGPRAGKPYASGCNGDSGGPLLRTTDGEPMVVGIDSWGVACGALDGDPEVFVRMSHERAWVTAATPPWTEKRIRDPWDPPAFE